MDPDPDFSGSDPDFRPIRIQIRTQERKFDSDPEKNPDPKHWNYHITGTW